MHVISGRLNDVYGRPVRQGDCTFMAGSVDLDGSSFEIGHTLADHLGDRVPAVLKTPIENGHDAAWVRARILVIFGMTPGKAEAEKALNDIGFAAVFESGKFCYPFICTDRYGKSGLVFSESGLAEATQASVASSFWDLLLLHPEELADFEQRVYHPGTGIWMTFGCDSGRIHCEEEFG